jgi:hypothetical protein
MFILEKPVRVVLHCIMEKFSLEFNSKIIKAKQSGSKEKNISCGKIL